MAEKGDDGGLPGEAPTGWEWGDEPWQNDRPVFVREEKEQTLPTGETKTYKVLAVGFHARQRWSDKNPAKFDPDTALRIVQYIGGGAFQQVAAAAAGICKETFTNWLKAGHDPKHPRSTEELRAWAAAMDEAAAMAEALAVQGILRAGAQNWQAYAWYLERTHPERYRQRNSVIPENADGTPLKPPVLEVTMFDGGDATSPIETPPAKASDG